MSETIVYDLAEPIEAYRCWGTIGFSLVSMSFSYAWGREIVAEPCHVSHQHYMWGPLSGRRCEGAPCREGLVAPFANQRIARGCGIYAISTLSGALNSVERNGVLGKVLLGGKVWPYDGGYRAEHAKIVGLYPMQAFDPLSRYLDDLCRGSGGFAICAFVDEIAKSYDVPLLKLTETEHDELRAQLQVRWVQRVLQPTGRVERTVRHYTGPFNFNPTTKTPAVGIHFPRYSFSKITST